MWYIERSDDRIAVLLRPGRLLDDPLGVDSTVGLKISQENYDYLLLSRHGSLHRRLKATNP